MFSYSKIKNNLFEIKENGVVIAELSASGNTAFSLKRIDWVKLEMHDDLHIYAQELSRKNIWSYTE